MEHSMILIISYYFFLPYNRHILHAQNFWFIQPASGGMYIYDDAMRLQRLFLRRATVCFSCESNKKASVEFECSKKKSHIYNILKNSSIDFFQIKSRICDTNSISTVCHVLFKTTTNSLI